jgi:hypothetical protein
MKTIAIKGSVRLKDHGQIHDGFEFVFSDQVREYGRNSIWLDNTTDARDVMPGNVVGLRVAIIEPQKPIMVSFSASSSGFFEIRGPMVARPTNSSKCWIKNVASYADGNNVNIWIGGMGVDWTTGS